MCGRFVSAKAPDDIAQYFDAETPEALLDRSYNVAPTNDVYAVTEGGGIRKVEAFHWGLVPIWAKDPKVGSKMINARSEGIETKNAYRAAFKRRRCIIPADGFYEWEKRQGSKRKQPHYIHRPDGEMLAFAGLWEVWRGPKDKDRKAKDGEGGEGGEKQPSPFEDSPLRSCTIITTSANGTMSKLHDRMPVILPPSAWEEWLDPSNDDVETLGKLLVPAPDALLVTQPVSTEVNVVRNKGPELIEPIDPDEPDPSLEI